jgi:glycosyltransferase involved in cell wall biosynthesis
MRIGMIAPPWFPLPPKGYGGIELVVGLLTEGLVQRGHDVTLFASGDSQTLASLSYVYDRAPSEKIATHSHIEVIHGLEAYSRAREFDLIHDHDGFASRSMGALAHRLVGTPVVATLHGPADPHTQESLGALRESLRFIAISDYQRNGFPDLHFLATIPNAIDLAHHPFGDRDDKEDYLLFVGRMIADKGAHTAVEVARRLEARLIMAGKINEQPERDFFAERVEPYLSDRIYFRGEVDSEGKGELFRRARCTLFPIQWPEPFGLVMIESLAAGTPVVAFRRGSVPEVLEHGRTGFIVETVDEMVDAVARVGEIDPQECRKSVEERFGVDGFVRRHEQVYEGLLREAPSWTTLNIPGPLVQ